MGTINSVGGTTEVNILSATDEIDDYGSSQTQSKPKDIGDYSALGTDIAPKSSFHRGSDSSVGYIRTTRTLSDAAYEKPATSGIPGAVFNFTNSMFVNIYFIKYSINIHPFFIFQLN